MCVFGGGEGQKMGCGGGKMGVDPYSNVGLIFCILVTKSIS